MVGALLNGAGYIKAKSITYENVEDAYSSENYNLNLGFTPYDSAGIYFMADIGYSNVFEKAEMCSTVAGFDLSEVEYNSRGVE